MTKELTVRKRNLASMLKVQQELTSTHTLYQKTLFQAGLNFLIYPLVRLKLLVVLKSSFLEIWKGRYSQTRSSKDKKSIICVLKSLVSLNQQLFFQKVCSNQQKTARHAKLRLLNLKRDKI